MKHAANATVSLRLGKIKPEQVAPLQELAEMRAFDKLFLETGIDREDILFSSNELGFDQDPDFKAMMQGFQVKYKEMVQTLVNKLAGPNT